VIDDCKIKTLDQTEKWLSTKLTKVHFFFSRYSQQGVFGCGSF